MLLELINKFQVYILGVMIILIGVLSMYVLYLRLSNAKLQSEVDMNTQAEKILTEEYIKRSKEADERNVIVEKEYVVRVKNVDHWYKGEGNATAKDAIDYLDNYPY